MKYYIPKFLKGTPQGWSSPETKVITVIQNSEGDSGYRGGTRHKHTNKPLLDLLEEDFKKINLRLEERANDPSTDEIDLNGYPRVIGMSGYDPLLGTSAEWIIGGKMTGDVLKGIGTGFRKYVSPYLKKFKKPSYYVSSDMSNLRLTSPAQGNLSYADIEDVLNKAVTEELRYRLSPEFIRRAKASGIYKDKEIPELIEEYKKLAKRISTKVSNNAKAEDFGFLLTEFDINDPKAQAVLEYMLLKNGTLGLAFGTGVHEFGGHGLSFPFAVSNFNHKLTKEQVEWFEKTGEKILKKHYPLISRAKEFNSDLIKKELRPFMKQNAFDQIRKYKYRTTASLQKENPLASLDYWKDQRKHWLDYMDDYINSDSEIIARTHAADRMENLGLAPGKLLTDLKILYPEHNIKNIMNKHLVWGLPTALGFSAQNKKSGSNQ